VYCFLVIEHLTWFRIPPYFGVHDIGFRSTLSLNNNIGSLIT